MAANNVCIYGRRKNENKENIKVYYRPTAMTAVKYRNPLCGEKHARTHGPTAHRTTSNVFVVHPQKNTMSYCSIDPQLHIYFGLSLLSSRPRTKEIQPHVQRNAGEKRKAATPQRWKSWQRRRQREKSALQVLLLRTDVTEQDQKKKKKKSLQYEQQ